MGLALFCKMPQMKDFVPAHFTPGLESGKSLVLPSLVMPTKVTVLNHGPIRIEGEFEILDPAGATFGLAGRTVISLCRCGQSANKPFCDGSHARTGFNHPVEARELPPPKPKR
jgi:CDGSH-type Zn-finger protein